MGKRHAGHRFMPGKYVFPGGRVEPEDRRMSAAGALDPHVEAKLNARVRRPRRALRGRSRLPRSARPSRRRASRSESAITARRTKRRRAFGPGCGDRRLSGAQRHRLSRARDHAAGTAERFDARFLVIDARYIAKRVEGVVHPEAELVDLVWTPLDKARELDLPNITRLALDDLAAALDSGLDRRRPRPFYRELRGKRFREEL